MLTWVYKYQPKKMEDVFAACPSAASASAVTVVVGPDGNENGTTAVIARLLYHRRTEVDVGVVFCPRPKAQHLYQRFIPSTHVHTLFSSSALHTMYEAQEQIHRWAPCDKHRQLAIVLDGIGDGIKDKSVHAIIANGRLLSTSLTLGVPGHHKLPPAYRGNVDMWVFASCLGNSDTALGKAYNEVLHAGFPCWEDCRSAFDALGSNEYLVFHAKRHQARRLAIFKLSLDAPMPPFRIGREWVWRMHGKHVTSYDALAHKPSSTHCERQTSVS